MSDHDHDVDYAAKHHRHYDLEREVEELRGQVRQLRAIMIEFGLDLSEVQGRIHALEEQEPQPAAESAADRVVIDLRTDPPMPLVGPMTRADCEAWIRANPEEGSPVDLAIVPQSTITDIVNGDGR